MAAPTADAARWAQDPLRVVDEIVELPKGVALGEGAFAVSGRVGNVTVEITLLQSVDSIVNGVPHRMQNLMPPRRVHLLPPIPLAQASHHVGADRVEQRILNINIHAIVDVQAHIVELLVLQIRGHELAH